MKRQSLDKRKRPYDFNFQNNSKKSEFEYMKKKISRSDNYIPDYAYLFEDGGNAKGQKTRFLKKMLRMNTVTIILSCFFSDFSGGGSHTHGMRKFPGQGSNPHHSSNPSCCRDNTGSSTTRTPGNSSSQTVLQENCKLKSRCDVFLCLICSNDLSFFSSLDLLASGAWFLLRCFQHHCLMVLGLP